MHSERFFSKKDRCDSQSRSACCVLTLFSKNIATNFKLLCKGFSPMKSPLKEEGQLVIAAQNRCPKSLPKIDTQNRYPKLLLNLRRKKQVPSFEECHTVPKKPGDFLSKRCHTVPKKTGRFSFKETMVFVEKTGSTNLVHLLRKSASCSFDPSFETAFKKHNLTPKNYNFQIPSSIFKNSKFKSSILHPFHLPSIVQS